MTYNPDRPAWDQLCELTTGWLLAAPTVTEQRMIWALKLRTRRIYEAAVHPEQACRKMLLLLLKMDRGRQRRAA